MDETATCGLDTQALEQILIGHMMAIAGEANQIFRPVTMFDHGISGAPFGAHDCFARDAEAALFFSLRPRLLSVSPSGWVIAFRRMNRTGVEGAGRIVGVLGSARAWASAHAYASRVSAYFCEGMIRISPSRLPMMRGSMRTMMVSVRSAR